MGNLKWKPARTGDPLINRNFDDLSTKLSAVDDIVSSMDLPIVSQVRDSFTVTDEDFIDYRGPGGKVIRLPPANENTGRARRLYIQNNGSGTLVINTYARDFLDNGTVAAGTMALYVSNGLDTWRTLLTTAPVARSGHVIQDNGVDKTQRRALNFIGATVADNSGSDSTDVTVTPGHVIQDAGTDQTQRAKLDFIGFSVADDSANNRTKITALSTPLDHKVAATGTDTTPNYLASKLQSGTGISIATIFPGGNEREQITNTAPDDKKVMVTVADTTPGYLQDKVLTGVFPSLGGSVFHPGSNEKLDLEVPAFNVVSVSGNYTVNPTDFVIEYTGVGGHTITLPAANVAGSALARPILIVNNGGGSGFGVVTVAAAGSDKINGEHIGRAMVAGEAAHIVPNGSNSWRAFFSFGTRHTVDVVQGGRGATDIILFKPSADTTRNTTATGVGYTLAFAGHNLPSNIIGFQISGTESDLGSGNPDHILFFISAGSLGTTEVFRVQAAKGANNAFAKITGDMLVSAIATVSGRLNANGDQVRMGTHTVLVSPGAGSGSPEVTGAWGDLREIAFGDTNTSLVGNEIVGGGLVIKSEAGIKIATDNVAAETSGQLPGNILVTAASVDGSRVTIEAGNGGDNAGEVVIQPGTNDIGRTFRIFTGPGAGQKAAHYPDGTLSSVTDVVTELIDYLVAWGWLAGS